MVTLVFLSGLFLICCLGLVLALLGVSGAQDADRYFVYFVLGLICLLLAISVGTRIVKEAKEYDQQTSGMKGESK